MPSTTRSQLSVALGLALAACATDQTSTPGAASGTDGGASPNSGSLLYSSPECLAKRLKSGDPLPSGSIPQAAVTNRTSGSISIRYDVVDGAAKNLQVVASTPPGLYDEAALAHAAKYRDPTNSTARGCVMKIEVKF